MLAFGAIEQWLLRQSDIAYECLCKSLIIPAIIILGLNIWTTNDNALYGSGFDFQMP